MPSKFSFNPFRGVLLPQHSAELKSTEESIPTAVLGPKSRTIYSVEHQYQSHQQLSVWQRLVRTFRVFDGVQYSGSRKAGILDYLSLGLFSLPELYRRHFANEARKQFWADDTSKAEAFGIFLIHLIPMLLCGAIDLVKKALALVLTIVASPLVMAVHYSMDDASAQPESDSAAGVATEAPAQTFELEDDDIEYLAEQMTVNTTEAEFAINVQDKVQQKARARYRERSDWSAGETNTDLGCCVDFVTARQHAAELRFDEALDPQVQKQVTFLKAAYADRYGASPVAEEDGFGLPRDFKIKQHQHDLPALRQALRVDCSKPKPR